MLDVIPHGGEYGWTDEGEGDAEVEGGEELTKRGEKFGHPVGQGVFTVW